MNVDILDIDMKIKNSLRGAELHFYISETVELIEEYKRILKVPRKISFTANVEPKDVKKNKIIVKFMEIAKQHGFVASADNHHAMRTCKLCKSSSWDIQESNIYICTNCGTEMDAFIYTPSYSDIERINISSKYTYDRKIHFRDCVNQYQGKQNSNIDPQIYKDLEAQFKKHHLLVGKEGDPRDVRFSKIEKTHVQLFLKELGYCRQYENANLIHNKLTGIPLDDISHLEEKLMEDFDAVARVYDQKYKNKIVRKSFINSQFVLYHLLRRRKHPCKKEDFALLKTYDRIWFHEEIMKHIFAELGWSYVPYF